MHNNMNTNSRFRNFLQNNDLKKREISSGKIVIQLKYIKNLNLTYNRSLLGKIE